MTLASVKAHFLNWRQWELNAIVIKELRQSVRSWAVTGMLLLFLAVLFCTSLVFLVSQRFDVDVNQRLGSDLFQIFISILTFASLLFIPLYVGIRLALERQESNMDLLYVSTLSPGSIIRGKFLCGAYTAVLFFSACMPFMAFTNLLRGVDLPSIFLVLAYLFLLICAAVQVAIFLACLPITKTFKVLIALAALVAGASVSYPLIMFSWFLMRAGIGAMITPGGFWSAGGFWTGVAVSGSLILATWGLLYLASVALISPPSANRAFPLRVYITIVWFISGLCSIAWIYMRGDSSLIQPWGIVTFIVMIPTLLAVISNNDELSLRVRKDIPQNHAKRAVAFLFFNGAAGGLLWTIFLLATTLSVTLFFVHWGRITPSGFHRMPLPDVDEFFACATATVLYLLAYALTGLYLHRTFARKRSAKFAGLFTIIVVALVTFVPNIILFFSNSFSLRSIQGFQPGSMANVFIVEKGEEWLHVAVSLGWFILILLLNRGWFLVQARNFRPLERRQAPVLTPANPPPIP